MPLSQDDYSRSSYQMSDHIFSNLKFLFSELIKVKARGKVSNIRLWKAPLDDQQKDILFMNTCQRLTNGVLTSHFKITRISVKLSPSFSYCSGFFFLDLSVVSFRWRSMRCWGAEPSTRITEMKYDLPNVSNSLSIKKPLNVLRGKGLLSVEADQYEGSMWGSSWIDFVAKRLHKLINSLRNDLLKHTLHTNILQPFPYHWSWNPFIGCASIIHMSDWAVAFCWQ